MKQQLINQSAGIFNTQDKWDALFEIHNHSREIIDHWLTIGARALRESFAEDAVWVCEKWGTERDSRWFLKDDTNRSISIGFGWTEVELHLHLVSPADVDRTQAVALLENRKFKPLLELFELATSPPRHVGYGSVAFNLTINPFSGAGDTQVRLRELAWMASHKTDEYVGKMGGIIRRLTDDRLMIELFREFNRQMQNRSGSVTGDQGCNASEHDASTLTGEPRLA